MENKKIGKIIKSMEQMLTMALESDDNEVTNHYIKCLQSQLETLRSRARAIQEEKDRAENALESLVDIVKDKNVVGFNPRHYMANDIRSDSGGFPEDSEL